MATYFSGAKLRWLLDRDDQLRPAAERGDLLFGTMDSWIIWNLTGGPGTGPGTRGCTSPTSPMPAGPC